MRSRFKIEQKNRGSGVIELKEMSDEEEEAMEVCRIEEFTAQCERAVKTWHEQDLRGYVLAISYLSKNAAYVADPEYYEVIRRFEILELIVFAVTRTDINDNIVVMAANGIDTKAMFKLLERMVLASPGVVIRLNECDAPQKFIAVADRLRSKKQIRHLITLIHEMICILKKDTRIDMTQLAHFAVLYSEMDTSAVLLLVDVLELLDDIADADKLSFLSVFWRVLSPEYSARYLVPALRGIAFLVKTDPRVVNVKPKYWILSLLGCLKRQQVEGPAIPMALELLATFITNTDDESRSLVRESIDPVHFLAFLRASDADVQREAVGFFMALLKHSPDEYIENMSHFNILGDMMACAEDASFSVKVRIVRLFCEVARRSKVFAFQMVVSDGVIEFLLDVLEQLSLENDPVAHRVAETLLYLVESPPKISIPTQQALTTSSTFTRIIEADSQNSAPSEYLQRLMNLIQLPL